MKKSQCDYCLYLTYDEETDEHYCSLSLDQDDLAKLMTASYYQGLPF